MSLTRTQVAAAQAIVNIFETGVPLGEYGDVTVIPGDTGHLTFGRSQTTLGSGNLAKLLDQYCENAGARFADRLKAWMPDIRARNVALDNDVKLQNVLRATADDPVMRDTQDAFFDAAYWQPAADAAQTLEIATPLGVAVVYDGTVHGSFGTLRDQTLAAVGSPSAAGEPAWIAAYVQKRRNWLASSSRGDLRACTYRMDAFQSLIGQGRWGLDLPFVVRGQEVSTASLAGLPADCYDGPQPGARAIAVQAPLMRGLDVRLLQLGLSDAGQPIKADGVFGQHSSELLKSYQLAAKITGTGVADAALIAMLTS